MKHMFNVIAANPPAALAVAEMVSRGTIPDLYPTHSAVMDAWHAQPDLLRAMYRPWAVSVLTGKCDDLTKRLRED